MAPLSSGAALRRAFGHLPGRYVLLVLGMVHEQGEKVTAVAKKEPYNCKRTFQCGEIF